MSLGLQLRACFFKYRVQFRRFKGSFMAHMLLPIVCGAMIYLFSSLNEEEAFKNFYHQLILFYIGLSYNGYIRTLFGDVVNERKEKLKELMVMNGLSVLGYNIGLLMVGFVKCTMMALPFMVAFYFTNIPISSILAFFFLYALA